MIKLLFMGICAWNISLARFCVRDRNGNPFCPLSSGKKIAMNSPLERPNALNNMQFIHLHLNIMTILNLMSHI